MEDPNQEEEVEEEAEMPIPLNSTYGHGHVLHGHHVHMPRHHHHHHTSPSPPPLQIPPIHHHAPSVPIIHDDEDDDNSVVKRSRSTVVRYRECLKNHAASIGGTANDGCGEFMPAGEDGTLEALTCSACSCHRNFHRKEIDHGGGAAARRPEMMMKKRFRTKFSQEQKEKMLGFAERVGWRIQKQEESVVQSFCHEIGVKRRVLKVWMHNNKHTHLHLASSTTNKNNNNNNNNNNNDNTTNHDQTQV